MTDWIANQTSSAPKINPADFEEPPKRKRGGGENWSKGLTKETDYRVQLQAEHGTYTEEEKAAHKVHKPPRIRGKRGPKPGTYGKLPLVLPPPTIHDYIMKFIDIGKTAIAILGVVTGLFTFLWSVGLAPVTNSKLDAVHLEMKTDLKGHEKQLKEILERIDQLQIPKAQPSQ